MAGLLNEELSTNFWQKKLKITIKVQKLLRLRRKRTVKPVLASWHPYCKIVSEVLVCCSSCHYV